MQPNVPTQAGREVRKAVPRRRLAEWDPASRPNAALEVLFSQHAERDAELLPIRYGRMSASPWSYLRGAAAVKAADLAQYPNTGLIVRLCGDAHVLNYGLWASPERNLTFDVRDFDETLPGPFESDLKRLAASLVVCASARSERADQEAGAATMPEQLTRLLDRLTFTDVVRQVVGVGSVGMRVYLVLVEGRSGEAPLFLQIKQAGASVYEPYLAPSAHANHGHRIVVGQHLIQSATDLFTGWTRIGEFDFYVRQFRDMKIIPDSRDVAPYLTQFAASCAQALAKAHARSGDLASLGR